MAEFKPHSKKQDDAIFSEHKITALITGIQWGKTTSGALWLKKLIHTHKNKEDRFLVVAPSYKIMEQSSLPEFMKWMRPYGKFNKKEATFEVSGGGCVYFRTATEPDSIVGLTKIRGIWGDEAGKFSLYFWENIQGRAAFSDAPIMLTTSPYSMNWIYKEIVLRSNRGELPDYVKLIQASSDENPYFPKAEFERRKKNMDARRFQAMFGGKFEKMSGLVYDCYLEDEVIIAPFKLPNGTKYYAGVDWGYTEPFVIVVRAITPDGTHYQVSETYKSGLTITDMVRAAREKMQIFNIERFYCDPSQPAAIEEFSRNRIPAVAANNSIRLGIDKHYELIKTQRYKMFRDTSPHSEDEYETYHYPEPGEIAPDKSAKEVNPVGQNDHAMDANRYVTMGTQSVFANKNKITNLREKVTSDPLGSMFDFFERLKKKKDEDNFESWG